MTASAPEVLKSQYFPSDMTTHIACSMFMVHQWHNNFREGEHQRRSWLWNSVARRYLRKQTKLREDLARVWVSNRLNDSNLSFFCDCIKTLVRNSQYCYISFVFLCYISFCPSFTFCSLCIPFFVFLVKQVSRDSHYEKLVPFCASLGIRLLRFKILPLYILQRSIDLLRWLFDPDLLFILRWSCWILSFNIIY